MKSEKAKKYLTKVVRPIAMMYPGAPEMCDLKLGEAKHAVELAEQEAEERIREELTRWHDPKEKLPDNNRDVLVKTTLCREYCIAWYKADGSRNYHWHENNGALDDDMVIGWREIH